MMKVVKAALVLLAVAVTTLIILYVNLAASRTRSPVVARSHGHRPSGRKSHSSRVKSVAEAELFVDGEANFTVVVQTYRRNDLLFRVLRHYCEIGAVDRIIVVWNNLNVAVPGFLRNMSCGSQLFFKEQRENTIRNRFQPFPEIRTEGVASVDDDRFISEVDLLFAFSVWQTWKNLIVGWLPRIHEEVSPGNYHYHRRIESNKLYAKYSMILTGECFLHVSYLRLFNSTLPTSIQKMIDKVQSCEDIAMNMLVARHLALSGNPQCPGLLVKPKKKILNLEKQTKSNFRGLWMRPHDINTRHDCLNEIAKVFGSMSLRYSHIIIDPWSTYVHQI